MSIVAARWTSIVRLLVGVAKAAEEPALLGPARIVVESNILEIFFPRRLGLLESGGVASLWSQPRVGVKRHARASLGWDNR